MVIVFTQNLLNIADWDLRHTNKLNIYFFLNFVQLFWMESEQPSDFGSGSTASSGRLPLRKTVNEMRTLIR